MLDTESVSAQLMAEPAMSKPVLRAVAVLGLCTQAVACVTTHIPVLSPEQALSIVPHAIFIDNAGRGLTLDCSTATTVLPCPKSFDEQLDLIADSVQASPHRRILIRIHGGLNTLGSSLGTSYVMLQRMAADTGDTSSRVYPIFVNWESGLRSSYAEHLFFITQGQRYPTAGRALASPVYLGADVGRGITRALFTWGQAAENFARSLSRSGPDPIVANDDGIVRSVGAYHPTALRQAWFLTESLLLFPLIPVKAFELVFIDAGGTSAWDNMHRRTRVLFRDPNEFENVRKQKSQCDSARSGVGDRASGCDVESFSPATGALSLLLDRIQKIGLSDTSRRVTIIGHSMGAIVASEAVRTRDSIRFDNIVFMAGANSVREFDVSVVPYLARHPESQFYNLTLHPLADLREETLAGFGPNGSLLEWIDAFFADPDTDTDRMMGKYSNIREAEHMFAPGVRPQIHMKTFGYRDGLGCGPESEPYHHGGFNDASVPFWRKSFWEPSNAPCATFDTTSKRWLAR